MKEGKLYTTTEIILIVLFGPVLIVALTLNDFFPFYAGEGFKKKDKRGVFYLFLGIGLWILTLYIVAKSLE